MFFLILKVLVKLCLTWRCWHRKQSTHTKGVLQSSCEAMWFDGYQDRRALFWGLPSLKGFCDPGKAQHLSLSWIPSALLWEHGDFNRCRHLLLPPTWGRRNFPAWNTTCATSHPELLAGSLLRNCACPWCSAQSLARPGTCPNLIQVPCWATPVAESFQGHKLSLQREAELGCVTTWETQRLIPSTVFQERIPSAAHTYIAEQGLNPILLTQAVTWSRMGQIHTTGSRSKPCPWCAAKRIRNKEGCMAFTSLSYKK